MSLPSKPRGLGRGLSALLGDEDVAATVAPPPAARPAAPAAPASRAPMTLPTAHGVRGYRRAGRLGTPVRALATHPCAAGFRSAGGVRDRRRRATLARGA